MTHQLDPMTFPLHGTRLIEASAGTGKTYTIAALYLRLVLGHGGENGYGRPLMPPEILVVTFTNAATQELRERIRQQLTQAALFFRNTGDGDDYLIHLRDAFSDENRLDAARVLDQAAQWMDEAAIYTIHSWAQRMLRQHAFDSKSLFELELEPDDQDVLETAACDYWRSHYYSQPSVQLAAVMELVGCTTPQELLEKVRPLLNMSSHSAKDPFVMLEQRLQAIAQARQKWASDLDGAVDMLQKAQADKTLNGNRYRLTSLNKWLAQLIDWTKDRGGLPDENALEKLSYSGLKAGLNKNKSLPMHFAFGIFDELKEQLADLNIDSALLYHAAEDIGQRFFLEKQRRGQMGYDDLLTCLNAALQDQDGEQLAQEIQQQFPVALIDEFQDTDPVQYAAFCKIYFGQADTGLFMIGDPKQAIYAFRGADIHTYLSARRDTADRHYTLGRNYRSTEGMVQAVNQMFATAANYSSGAFLFGDKIPFDPVTAQGHHKKFLVDGEPVTSMHWWHLSQTEPIPKTGEKGYLFKMAEGFAGEITRLLNLAHNTPPKTGFQEPDGSLKALRPADIAVLVRDGREAKAIRKALAKRDIRSVYLSDNESVFTSDEAKQMLFLLRACSHPKQENYLKAALASPVLELSWAGLDRLNQDENLWEAEVERFSQYLQIWQCQGVLPMFRTLLQDFGVATRLLCRTGGERVLTNLLHLAELLQTQANVLDGEQALIRWLAEKVRQPGSSSDEYILRLESDDDLIRVITIHKSKGLEYPLVFLPFICSFRQMTKRNASVVRYHDCEGRLVLVPNPEEADLKTADRERLAEDLRLLYVAVTRPCFACWLGIGVMGTQNRRGENSKLHLSAMGYLLSAEAHISTQQLPDRLMQLKGDCQHIAVASLPTPDNQKYTSGKEHIPLVSALKVERQVPYNWWIASYSAISAGAGKAAYPVENVSAPTVHAAYSATEDQLQELDMKPPATAKVKDSQRSIHDFPHGPQPGTFLHGLLEWAAGYGFYNLAGDRKMVYDKLQQFCKPRGWDEWIEVLTDWFLYFLKIPLILPESQEAVVLAEIEAENYQSELEFLFAAHKMNTRILDNAVTAGILAGQNRPRLQDIHVNGMIKGFIDLAFCHKGRYYVMDYKSNYLGEDEQAYGPDAMANAILEHRYDLQYVLYTLAMHRLLKARLPDYDYQRDMGGAVYVFLRGVASHGQGVYIDKPPWSLIQRLDDGFAGRKEGHAE